MGQSGAGGRTDRRRHSDRWEGDQTKKNRRPDRPNRVRAGTSGGGGAEPALGRGKKDKYLELSDGTGGEQGQERELCRNLHLIGEVLHCSTPPTPKS